MTAVISLRFQVAGRPSGEWAQGNPVILDRELAVERDTSKIKLGDGVKAWSDLPYQSFWSRWGRIEGQIADQPDLAAALALRLLASEKGAANGVASLGPDGKLPSSQLPPVAITSTFVVNSQAAQLALVVEEGDVAIRTDLSRSYIRNAGTAGTMADWNELLTPTDAVVSVNGQTGAVVITTISGNAGSATKLFTARAINGVAFDGTSAITVPAVDTATPRAALAGAAFTGGITGTTGRFSSGGTFGGTGLGTSAQMELTGSTFAYLILDDRSANTGRRFAFGSGFTRAGVFGIYDYTSQKTVLEIDSTAALMPGSDNTQPLGTPSRRFSQVYAGNATIATSDADEKQDIDAIPDEWLDAWGDVEWSRFRFRDAVEAKGESARWHTGLIAQRVRDAFAARGLDATRIGLLCFDRWDEVVTEDEDGVESVAIPAGERWGLRYTECFAIEAAWVRRQLSRLS